MKAKKKKISTGDETIKLAKTIRGIAHNIWIGSENIAGRARDLDGFEELIQRIRNDAVPAALALAPNNDLAAEALALLRVAENHLATGYARAKWSDKSTPHWRKDERLEKSLKTAYDHAFSICYEGLEILAGKIDVESELPSKPSFVALGTLERRVYEIIRGHAPNPILLRVVVAELDASEPEILKSDESYIRRKIMPILTEHYGVLHIKRKGFYLDRRRCKRRSKSAAGGGVKV